MEYKLTKRSRNIYFNRIILSTFSLHLLGFIVLAYFYDLNDSVKLIKIGIAVFLAWMAFFNIPLIILYSNHLKFSKSTVFKNLDNQYFVFKNKKGEIRFSIEDVEKIELYLSPPYYDKRVDFLYFGKYHYTSIYLKSSVIISISCLVFDKPEDLFSDELIVRRKKAFPTIPRIG